MLLAHRPAHRATVVDGPAIIEEFGSTVPLHPGFTARVDEYLNIIVTRSEAVSDSRRAPTDFPFGHLTDDAGASADPVLVEIVQGSLASVEMEVETAIGRTSRSPMIRDAHDFRAGIHDRLLRKLTGRSYSALVHPVARDFPIEEMREGDVFFHNDVYRSEGGIGHLPDLCVTVPVFSGAGDAGGRVRPGVRPPRRHRRRRTRLDALQRHQRLRGGPDGPPDPALGRRRAQPGGAERS